ncbi:hypothetical protein OG749_47015 (plasmid) [Streptomyces nojiriensis]|uniref:hypothetical protein n=1 Tax=Streptomyces nojiriensis TaxID=66374 RepID=UPI002E179940
MGQDRPQPRRTSALDSLRNLSPGTELVKIRANPNNWSQAELLAAYTWPRHQGERLVPIEEGRYPDDSNHTALTIGEFLSIYRHLPVVSMIHASDTAYTYVVQLAHPSWSLAAGDPR